jgi:NTP pyrophosphatase (non-canonical NTP hydrolase)
MNLNELAKEIHQNAIEHGFWETEREFGSLIALMHSELSEALEAYRDSDDKIKGLPIYYSGGGFVANLPTLCCKKPEGIAVELADCIIRILDYCGKEGINIEDAIRIKYEYNKSRPYRHGGKKA